MTEATKSTMHYIRFDYTGAPNIVHASRRTYHTLKMLADTTPILMEGEDIGGRTTTFRNTLNADIFAALSQRANTDSAIHGNTWEYTYVAIPVSSDKLRAVWDAWLGRFDEYGEAETAFPDDLTVSHTWIYGTPDDFRRGEITSYMRAELTGYDYRY